MERRQRKKGPSDSSNVPKVLLEDFPDANLERYVRDIIHLAIVHRRETTDGAEKGLQTPLVWELIYRAGSPASEAALHFVESRLKRLTKRG